MPAPDKPAVWQEWRHPADILSARRMDDVMPVLRAAEDAGRRGAMVIGFVSYEAGPACDPHLIAHNPEQGIPLVWFAVFEQPAACLHPAVVGGSGRTAWKPAITRAAYHRHVAAIKEHIARGDTYQVNFTFPLHSTAPIDMERLFYELAAAQPTPYAMLIETPVFSIASASPELFFAREQDRLVCEPMKGTCARGPRPELDAAMGRRLQASEKNRAENLMVVDMVRNDLGRIAAGGSVTVDTLFEVKAWPTLWQMTSRISAQSNAPLDEVFRALFPSASITGAPKIQTTSIIAAHEQQARGVYTGAIGWCGPGGRSQFAVAIRTAVQVKDTGRTAYHVGSGIVWDSQAADEYRECLLKARILQRPLPNFRLLETLRWDRNTGYVLLYGHLARLAASARHWGWVVDPSAADSCLQDASRKFLSDHERVRLLVDRQGRFRVEHQSLPGPGHYNEPAEAPTMTVRVDTRRLTGDDPFIYHKTTRRQVYRAALRRHPDVEDVLLVNRRGECMEFTNGNLVIRMGDAWLTPPVTSGLLPGVFRQHLLEQGRIREAIVDISQLDKADAVYFINSVRGWRRVRIVTT